MMTRMKSGPIYWRVRLPHFEAESQVNFFSAASEIRRITSFGTKNKERWRKRNRNQFRWSVGSHACLQPAHTTQDTDYSSALSEDAKQETHDAKAKVSGLAVIAITLKSSSWSVGIPCHAAPRKLHIREILEIFPSAP